MTTSTVYYFVDSNLFFQCQPLEQIDWAPWDGFEEVRLIVSNPVLREIDYRKSRGNGRVGSRARAASAMFRKMLKEGHRVAQPGNPRVILVVEPQHTYSPELDNRLDYRERDDQLVGTALKYSDDHHARDVRLLTHDTTPLYTAHGLSLTADQIPDSWLIPPETTPGEKEMASLKAENSRLRKKEPCFSIRCMGPSNSEIECYEASHTSFQPLTDQHVLELMHELKSRFPLETDFGSPEPAERALRQTALNAFLGTKDVFSPATDKEISEYRDKAYPQWLSACEETLRNHHRTLQDQVPKLEFSFLAENVGTRPATDALVTIEDRGGFRILPPSACHDEGEDDEDISGNAEASVLKPPPVAPSGEWQQLVGGHHPGIGRSLNSLARSIQAMQGLTDVPGTALDFPSLHVPLVQPPSHDSNAFYYKPNRPVLPKPSFSLECDQWRHGDGEEPFDGEIFMPTDQRQIKGALLFRIQAANSSMSASKLVPVRIDITRKSAFSSAQAMLKALVERPEIRIPSS